MTFEFQKLSVIRFWPNIWACIVPRLLSEDKQNRVDVSKEPVDRANANENFLTNVSQVMKLAFTAMMSKQKPSLCSGSQKRHPHPIKHGKFGPMWKWCFNCEGVIHHELPPRGQTVNNGYYMKVIKRLRGAMRRKRPDLWRGKVAGPSRQRSGSFLSSDSWFSRQTWDDARPPTSVRIGPCTSGLPSFRHAEIRPERTTICVLSRRLKKIRWHS